MRILVDQSGYELLNVGDVAMLQSCIIRLQRLWPEAEIMVIVRGLERLSAYSEGSLAIERSSGLRLLKLIPRRYIPVWESASPYFSAWLGRRHSSSSKPRSVVQAVEAADIVVAAGGGYITDAFWLHATGVLGVLSLAQRLGKPTAMFGQGIGPINLRGLRIQARTVLPKLAALTLREEKAGPELALSLGVAPDVVSTTGDEALELIDTTVVPEGHALGVNMRVASYAGVDPVAAAAIGGLLLESADDLKAPIVALPVSRGPAGEDLCAIRALLRLGDSRVDLMLNELVTPAALMGAAASCRVIVTGSYHAAVFGLAQGVPTIGVTKSAYYDAKFAGLQALFPGACTVVSLDQADCAVRLRTAIQEAWQLPAGVRAAARDSAVRQRSAGRAAYERFRNVIEKEPAMVDT
jgi:polysaccharide pyruvyl transferase WcaK-like protein